jgi:hypothetical protein
MMNRLLIATLALSFFTMSHGFAPAFRPRKLAFKSACQELKSTMENQDQVAEIAAHLRQKVDSGAAALR